MQDHVPHYLLLSETAPSELGPHGGRWRFVLQQIGGSEQMSVCDCEPGVDGERLQLLTVVRGLEALDQPSRVTLITTSQYVGRGICRCLPQWRRTHWQWERFGQLAPIKNQDLWRRLDRALRYHQVDCRTWRLTATRQTSGSWASAADSAQREAPMPRTRRERWTTPRRRPLLDRWAAAARRFCDRLGGATLPQANLRQTVA